MAIFGFKKRKDEKLEQSAQATKSTSSKKMKKAIMKKAVEGAKTSKVVATKVSTKKVSVPTLNIGVASTTASVILRPRITEKTGILSQSGVYTFEVAKNANKNSISKAIMALYKVTPIKVSMINTPVRNVFVKGKKGHVAGIKKAIVTVKKGEKIDFV